MKPGRSSSQALPTVSPEKRFQSRGSRPSPCQERGLSDRQVFQWLILSGIPILWEQPFLNPCGWSYITLRGTSLKASHFHFFSGQFPTIAGGAISWALEGLGATPRLGCHTPQGVLHQYWPHMVTGAVEHVWALEPVGLASNPGSARQQLLTTSSGLGALASEPTTGKNTVPPSWGRVRMGPTDTGTGSSSGT